MISRQHRFHGHGSLKYVNKNANAVRSKWFVVKAVQNRFRPHSRVAVVVSRKVHKRAVIRNRIRRRVYEVIRQELPSLELTYDIVVIVTSAETWAAEAGEIKTILCEQLERANIYQKSAKPTN
jgi:ribonuclease P protein component